MDVALVMFPTGHTHVLFKFVMIPTSSILIGTLCCNGQGPCDEGSNLMQGVQTYSNN
jgi:hypothetical protein